MVKKVGDARKLTDMQERLKVLHKEMAAFITVLNNIKGLKKDVNQRNAIDRHLYETLDESLKQMEVIRHKIMSNELDYHDLKKDRDVIHRDFLVVENGAATAFSLCRMHRIDIPKGLEERLEQFRTEIGDLKNF